MSKVTYTVKKPIYGFAEIESVDLVKNDGMTSILQDEQSGIQLSLINTFIGEENFEVPASIKALLDINDDTNISVYFVVVLNKSDLSQSTINLGAPMIFNEDNQTMAQMSISTESSTLAELFNIN